MRFLDISLFSRPTHRHSRIRQLLHTASPIEDPPPARSYDCGNSRAPTPSAIVGDMSSEAAELKAQGAIEAAEKVDNRAVADAAQKELVEQSKNAGVAAFSFDPDASPEEKRAQARAVRPYFPFASLSSPVVFLY